MALFTHKNDLTPVVPAAAPVQEELPELDFLKERAANPNPADAPAQEALPELDFLKEQAQTPPAPAPALSAAAMTAGTGFAPATSAFQGTGFAQPVPVPVSAAPATPQAALPELDFLKHTATESTPESTPAFLAPPVAAPAAPAAAEITYEEPAFKHDSALDDYEWELAEPAEKTAAPAENVPVVPLSSPVSGPARPVGFVASPSATAPVIAAIGAVAPISIPGLSIPTQYSPLVLSGANSPVITVSRSGLSYIAKDSLRSLTAYGQDEYDALRELFRMAGRDMTAFTRALPPMQA